MTNSTDYPNHATLQIRSSVLGSAPKDVQCQVHALAANRLTLVSPERVALSSAVSVEYNDTMLLCEVMACTQDCEQKWHLELKVEQVLTGLQSMVRLRERLLGESAPSRRGSVAAAGVRA